MSDTIDLELSSDRAIIKLGEKFNFRMQQEFSQVYQKTLEQESIANYTVDFESTSYVDSTALGMLLVFRQKVGRDKLIDLKNCNSTVKSILEIANFGTLFNIV